MSRGSSESAVSWYCIVSRALPVVGVARGWPARLGIICSASRGGYRIYERGGTVHETLPEAVHRGAA